MSKFLDETGLAYFWGKIKDYVSSHLPNGIYVGTTAPTDPDTNVWVDTSSEAQSPITLDMIYPVGSIYMSVNSTSPATLFGGTWERIQDTFLLAAGTNHAAGSTGGEENHVLTVNEIPSHNHNYAQYVGSVGWSGSSSWNVVKTTNDDGYTNTNASGYMSTFNKGGGQAHNNMPPYLVVYMWKRTA